MNREVFTIAAALAVVVSLAVSSSVFADEISGTVGNGQTQSEATSTDTTTTSGNSGSVSGTVGGGSSNTITGTVESSGSASANTGVAYGSLYLTPPGPVSSGTNTGLASAPASSPTFPSFTAGNNSAAQTPVGGNSYTYQPTRALAYSGSVAAKKPSQNSIAQATPSSSLIATTSLPMIPATTSATMVPTQTAAANASAGGLGDYWWLIALAILAVLGIGAWAWAGSSENSGVSNTRE